MKNRYEIRGDVTIIFLKRRDGTIVETAIETSDFELVNQMPGTWHSKWSDYTQSYYVSANIRGYDGKWHHVSLHRYLLGDNADHVIDHVNNDTLDNRRSNLRFLSYFGNAQNRAGANRTNLSSGIRGVSRRPGGKWQARATLNNVSYYLGQFDTKTDAAYVVMKFWEEHMPSSVIEYREAF